MNICVFRNIYSKYFKEKSFHWASYDYMLWNEFHEQIEQIHLGLLVIIGNFYQDLGIPPSVMKLSNEANVSDKVQLKMTQNTPK